MGDLHRWVFGGALNTAVVHGRFDDQALDRRVGTRAEPGPLVAQLVRRGSCDAMHATEPTERIRRTIQDRLSFTDYVAKRQIIVISGPPYHHSHESGRYSIQFA